MGPVMQWSGERPLEEITLLVYPEGASRFELYEDDGRSNAYRRGVYALTRIECDVTAGALPLRIGGAGGGRAGGPGGPGPLPAQAPPGAPPVAPAGDRALA